MIDSAEGVCWINPWTGIFKDQILTELPVDELRKYYHETDGSPTNEMYSMVGLMTLQQMHDLTDEQAVEHAKPLDRERSLYCSL